METEQMAAVAGAGGTVRPVQRIDTTLQRPRQALEQRPAGLPVSSDRSKWTEDEAAAIEAAGLVFTYQYGDRKGDKVLAPRAVVAQFLHLAAKTGLDPLARQLYCIGRLGSDGLEWSMQTGIDGFRVVAERSGKYAGQDAAEWLTTEHGWVDVFIPALHGEHPLAARVRVYRHDWQKPAVGIAVWDEYAQTKRNGELTAMWKQRGPGQLAKCAEALALRKAHPQDLSGLYTADELGNAVQALEQVEPEVPAGPKSRVSRSAAPESVEAPVTPDEGSEAVTGRTASDAAGSGEVSLFPCARCGEHAADEEGQLCSSCEAEVEAEIAAEQEGAGS